MAMRQRVLGGYIGQVRPEISGGRLVAEPQLRSILMAVFLFVGGGTLLIAVLLAMLTGEGWPKLALSALALLLVAGFLITRELRTPS